jgi:hypothetical protein
VVVPDGDVHANERVRNGIKGLLEALEAAGATALCVDLSAYRVVTPKIGIDDLIVVWRAVKEDPAQQFEKLPRLTSSFTPQFDATAFVASVGTLAEPPPAPLDVIPGLLPCRNGVLAAPGNERKSTVMVFTAAHVALGRSIFGRGIARPGRVLYVTGEDSLEDVQRTLHYIHMEGGLPLSTEEAARLADKLNVIEASAVPGHPRLIQRGRDGLCAGGLFSLVEHAVQHYGDVTLIVFDTLSSLGVPENDGGMQDAPVAYHQAAHRLANRYGICVLGIHHVSKEVARNRTNDAYVGRGGGAIADNARFVLQLQRDNGSDDDIANYPAPHGITRADRQGGAAVLRLHAHKMRWSPMDLSPGRPYWLRAEGWCYRTFAPLTDAQRVVVQQTQIQNAQADDDALVLDAIRRSAVPVSKNQLNDMTIGKLGRPRRKAAVERLVHSGRVVMEKGVSNGQGPKPWVYTAISDEKF